MPVNPQPFALFITGEKDQMFDLSDQLGFEGDMTALAVSLFEGAQDSMHLQALFPTHQEAKSCLAGLAFPRDLEHFIVQLDDEDWVTKTQQGLPPVDAGRFFIYGIHDKDKVRADTPYPIHIEAGMAFGTGHHGTTKGCLLAFDRLITDEYSQGINAPKTCLDLGCGAGILAIAAAKALNMPVFASDIDPDAITVTQANAGQNAVADLVNAFWSDGFTAPQLEGQQFDLIFANILAGPLIGLAPDIAKALASNGTVILSGILNEQADRVETAFKAQGVTAINTVIDTGWTTFTARKI